MHMDHDQFTRGTKELKCSDDEFPCIDGTRCIETRMFCDLTPNCFDESDERLRKHNVQLDSGSAFCLSNNSASHQSRIYEVVQKGFLCVLPKKRLSNVKNYCTEVQECPEDTFACADGSQCIEGKEFCDGLPNCRDGSDETYEDQPKNNHSNVTFYQFNPYRICTFPTSLVPLNGNIWNINLTGKLSFRCLSYPALIMSISNLCNGMIDCPDLSDECLCPFNTRPGICRRLAFDSQTPHRRPHLKCQMSKNAKQVRLNVTMICNGKSECSNDVDETDCHRNISGSVVTKRKMEKDHWCRHSRKRARKCDGIPECRLGVDDECNCNSVPEFCNLFVMLPPARLPSCRNQFLPLYPEEICDGKAECFQQDDERGCNLTRFYCLATQPVPNIPLEKKCDRNEKCDGFQDCSSSRDECVCVDTAFSDDESLITNKAMLALVWAMSAIAVIGCVTVIILTLRDLRNAKESSRRNTSVHTKLIKMQILSLSLSDLLVAVYALAICIKGVEFYEGYCKVDFEWRSGNTCSALGALLVVGSEQSVFTMLLIAGARLYSVLRPFSPPHFRFSATGLLVTWLISILLGFIPLLEGTEGYFVSSVWFHRNPLLKVIYQNETQYYLNWLGIKHHQNISGAFVDGSNWRRIEKLATEINPNITIAFKFGYYSSHTVCLPTLFPNPSVDPAWGYTLFLLTINFVAFLSMFIAYIILYKNATTNEAVKLAGELYQERLKQNTMLQRKLMRIVVSDFLCWMPICAMGFLQILGLPIPRDAYLPAGLLIIPINSALNPLLYSDISDYLITKMKKAINGFRSKG